MKIEPMTSVMFRAEDYRGTEKQKHIRDLELELGKYNKQETDYNRDERVRPPYGSWLTEWQAGDSDIPVPPPLTGERRYIREETTRSESRTSEGPSSQDEGPDVRADGQDLLEDRRPSKRRTKRT